MLDSEFEIWLASAVICIKRVLHGKEIAQYSQNCKRHEVDQGHSKKSSASYI